MVNEERIRNLLNRYADNKASESEISEMLKGLEHQEGAAALESLMKELFEETGKKPSASNVNWEVLWSNVNKKTESPVRKMLWMRIAAAVVFILISSMAGYYYLYNSDRADLTKSISRSKLSNDAAPGSNRAVLTLSDGTEIILDSADANGTITQQGNTKIIKLNDGELVYSSANGKPGEILYNTITTPKGGQYQIVLSDGSKVWLNAGSSLRFPTAFSREERRVELTGEGYFEVEENPAQPFIVSSIPSGDNRHRGVEVKVLGTHFNVNSYNDEAQIKVSLLKGSVQVANLNPDALTNSVSKERETKILKPGGQAQVSNTEGIRLNYNVDMEDVMAWKDGFFSFANADLESVMRQIARWYDVEVQYQGAIPKRQFEGKMQRNLKLSEVIRIIETNNIHFQINGKTLVVNP